MKRNHLVRFFVVLFMFVFVCIPYGVAAERATKEECVQKTKEAVALAVAEGLESVYAKINDPKGPFVWKDTYVFSMDMDSGMITAHPIKPKLIGKKLTGLKDVKGKMFFVEFIKVGREKGEGWVAYYWPKPGEKKPSPKDTFIKQVPGTSILMMAGVYQ